MLRRNLFPWLSELIDQVCATTWISFREVLTILVLLCALQRGVGDGAVGSSLSLVAPTDDKNYSRITKTLNAQFQSFHLDGRLLRAAQERVNVACKVVSAEGGERKSMRDNKWFQEQAAEAGLEVDESLLEETIDSSRSQQGELRRAKAQLAKLLSEPMQTQRYGKFLATNSARTQMEATAARQTALKSQGRKRRKHG